MPDEEKYFRDNCATFASKFDAAIKVSLSTAEKITDKRRAWCTWIFSRACAAGHSIQRLLVPIVSEYGVTIDHGSIGSLARAIIEADVMIAYLSEESISDIEWDCRVLIFHIHDCVARVRLFKGTGADDERPKHSDALKELRQRILENAHFKTLSADTQEKAVAGSLIYINGLRSAAEIAGWDKGEFDGLYNYLSMPSHSAPMSFYRMDDRRIDHKTIAPFQYYFAGLALELSSNSLESMIERLRPLFSDAANPAVP